ncbi:MAG: hypothetical protein PHV11_01125 [Candidatus Bipolaricaulis sp.]|nr:hypothetical protein [Candidatus Bipolaricaulis sp.]MDD5219153.1 hypothetical protein [Candidatus Bipolaricaulis sp.]
MNARYLAIDWLLDHSDVRREGFFDASSFSSYEAVFVDPIGISRHWTDTTAPGGDGARRTDPEQDRGFGRTLIRWMAKRREEADDLLKRRGGILVTRLYSRGEGLEVAAPGSPAERIDRYSWLPAVSLVDRHHQLAFPANARFVARRGSDVILERSGNPFEEYLREFEGRLRYAAVYQDLLSTPIDRFACVLARNRVGDPVAVEIPASEGRLVLLPPVEGVPPSREADVLAHAVGRSIERGPFVADPDWLPAYTLPGEDALADELSGLVERRDALHAKVEEVSARLEEKTRLKRLLYGQGRSLFGGAVAGAFAALGFDVETIGDLISLRSDEGNALVAAEASEEPHVGLAAYGRLHRELERVIADGEDPVKGVLVVSGSRELDPKRRPTQFAAEALRGCRAHGYCLMTSYQLYRLVQAASADRSKKALAALRRSLLETDGELRDVGDSEAA